MKKLRPLILAAVALTQSAWAQQMNFDVPAIEAIKAIPEFARQAGIQIVAPADQLKGITTPAIKGAMDTRAALRKLLIGTGLEIASDDGAVITLKGVSRASDDAKGAPHQSSRNPFQLVQLDQGTDSSASRSAYDADGRSAERADSSTVGRAIPEVLVKGSKALNMDIRRSRDDAQPYVIFDRQKIERSGATSLEDFLKQRLPMNTSALTYNQQSGGLGNLSQINLRGLGTNQTLILIDGRRAAGISFGGNPAQPDLNGIPLEAVDRIEILPTTASGIYGGSATGGVINVILRRDYAGAEVKLAYENSFDTDTAVRRIGLSKGFILEEGKSEVLLAGSYVDQNVLVMRDRDFLRDGRQRVLANNPDYYTTAATPPTGATTNIRSANGSPLFGPGTPSFTSVPVGYAGGGGLAPLQQNAGHYNLDLADSAQFDSGGRSLLGAPAIESLQVTARRRFHPAVEAFVDFSTSTNTSHVPVSGLELFSGLSGAFIPPDAPNNPFGQGILVTVPSAAGDGDNVNRVAARRLAGGVVIQLPKAWHLGADYTWDRSSSTLRQPRSAYAGELISDGTLDVLRDTSAFPLALDPYLQEFRTSPLRSVTRNASLRAAGPIGALPGGPIVFSALLERRDDAADGGTEFMSFGAGTPFIATSRILPRSQTIDSAYLELKLPLVSSRNKLRGIQELELQLAGRTDDYETDTSPARVAAASTAPITRLHSEVRSTDPTIGLLYRPIGALMLRASYGTGFRPPGIADFADVRFAYPPGFFTDPRRGNEPTGAFLATAGGNQDVGPEQSESWSAGVVFTPASAAGLRLSLDYTRIVKTDNITSLSEQQLIDNESAFPGRVTRGVAAPGDPFGAGQITAIDFSLVNFARLELEAFDLSIDYRWDTQTWGAVDFFALSTYQPHYRTQPVPGAALVENAWITADNPLKRKADVGLTWTFRQFTLGWSTHYFDSYQVANPALGSSARVILNQGSQFVRSQVYHDLSGVYRLGAGSPFAVLGNAEVQLGIKNAFNTRPPFDAANGATGFYSPFADPRLATYYLSLKTAF